MSVGYETASGLLSPVIGLLSILDCLQTFYLRRVDAVEKGITVIELGM